MIDYRSAGSCGLIQSGSISDIYYYGFICNSSASEENSHRMGFVFPDLRLIHLPQSVSARYNASIRQNFYQCIQALSIHVQMPGHRLRNERKSASDYMDLTQREPIVIAAKLKEGGIMLSTHLSPELRHINGRERSKMVIT